MATNMVHEFGTQLEVVRANTTSGQAMAIGQIPGVALTASETGTNKVTMKTDGVFRVPVLGPVAIGDIVYVVTASGVVNTVNTNIRFGYAMDAIAGATTTPIRVKIGY